MRRYPPPGAGKRRKIRTQGRLTSEYPLKLAEDRVMPQLREKGCKGDKGPMILGPSTCGAWSEFELHSAANVMGTTRST